MNRKGNDLNMTSENSAKVGNGKGERLTDRDKIFAACVLEGMPISQAAKEAGFAESVAKARAHEWLPENREDSTKPLLWDYYTERARKKFRLHEITADNVLNELKLIAFSDLSNFVDWYNDSELSDDSNLRPEEIFTKLQGRSIRVKSRREIPKALLPAIQSISETKDGITIKLYNKLDALDKLMKYLKMIQPEAKQPFDGEQVPQKIDLVVNGTRSPLLLNSKK